MVESKHQNSGKSWTGAEFELIKSLAKSGISLAEISDQVGRSPLAVLGKLEEYAGMLSRYKSIVLALREPEFVGTSVKITDSTKFGISGD